MCRIDQNKTKKANACSFNDVSIIIALPNLPDGQDRGQDLGQDLDQDLGQDLVPNLWNFPNKIVFAGISRNFLEFPGISWNFLEFPARLLAICWNFLEFPGISWNFLEFPARLSAILRLKLQKVPPQRLNLNLKRCSKHKGGLFTPF